MCHVTISQRTRRLNDFSKFFRRGSLPWRTSCEVNPTTSLFCKRCGSRGTMTLSRTPCHMCLLSGMKFNWKIISSEFYYQSSDVYISTSKKLTIESGSSEPMNDVLCSVFGVAQLPVECSGLVILSQHPVEEFSYKPYSVRGK